MTNPTPHGQVPEALIDLIDAYAETRHRYGRIHNPKTEAARKAVIEALSGAQALSAGPGASRAAPPSAYVNGAGIRAEDGASAVIRKLDARFHDIVTFKVADAAAASPTPPAEQQAQPGAVYAGLPDSVAWLAEYGGDVFTATQLLNFADRTHALRMQAAPKAAPGEPSADSLRHQNKLLAETLGACILASGIVRKDIDGFTGAELLHFGEDLRSMLEAAPKQEVQEPCGWTTGITWRPDTRLQSEQVIKITRDTQPKYGYTTPIYTAPQPAPAPLSDDVVRDAAFDAVRKKLCALPRFSFLSDGYGVRRVPDKSGSWIAFDAAHALFDPVAVDAALAAQGGQ